MINTIKFKSYKIFKEQQTLELKPITVLIGKNNSGKSAVVKLPTLIEASLNTTRNDAINLINDGIELGGELRDLIYGKANRTLDLEIDYNDTDVYHKLSINILVTEEKQKQSSKIAYWKLDNELELSQEGLQGEYVDENTETKFACEFQGFNLVDYYIADKRDSSGTIPHQTATLKTDYIGPIRAIPVRDYRTTTNIDYQKSGNDGENCYQFLVEDAFTTNKKLISEVSKWYENNFEGWGIRINQDRSPIYQIELQRGEIKQNIRDAGMGMCQVLPLVVRAFKPSDKEILIIIEEPESHLHPAAHGNLAEIFVDSLIQKNKRYLIETHSQNFVLRLRRLIAEKKLDKNNLVIYYVNFDENKNYSVLEEIKVDDFGGVNEWPEGIFSESLDEALAIRSIQTQKNNAS